MSHPPVPAKPVRPHGERFIINVLWSWTGVAAGLFQGFIITPFIIRRLGEEHYGIWLIIFSILEYFWFFDLGLNTAVCFFCARFLAVENHEKINEVICTSLFYFSIIALLVWFLFFSRLFDDVYTFRDAVLLTVRLFFLIYAVVNLAVAIVMAAVILGTCYIVAHIVGAPTPAGPAGP